MAMWALNTAVEMNKLVAESHVKPTGSQHTVINRTGVLVVLYQLFHKTTSKGKLQV